MTYRQYRFKLTATQRRQLEEAKRTMPKGGRIDFEFTPAQRRQWKRACELIKEELPDLIRRHQQSHDAAREKSFSGALRRAIHGSKMLLPRLAELAAVDMADIADFLCAEKSLSSDAIDRLTTVLKLKLVSSRPKPKPNKKAG